MNITQELSGNGQGSAMAAAQPTKAGGSLQQAVCSAILQEASNPDIVAALTRQEPEQVAANLSVYDQATNVRTYKPLPPQITIHPHELPSFPDWSSIYKDGQYSAAATQRLKLLFAIGIVLGKLPPQYQLRFGNDCYSDAQSCPQGDSSWPNNYGKLLDNKKRRNSTVMLGWTWVAVGICSAEYHLQGRSKCGAPVLVGQKVGQAHLTVQFYGSCSHTGQDGRRGCMASSVRKWLTEQAQVRVGRGAGPVQLTDAMRGVINGHSGESSIPLVDNRRLHLTEASDKAAVHRQEPKPAAGSMDGFAQDRAVDQEIIRREQAEQQQHPSVTKAAPACAVVQMGREAPDVQSMCLWTSGQLALYTVGYRIQVPSGHKHASRAQAHIPALDATGNVCGHAHPSHTIQQGHREDRDAVRPGTHVSNSQPQKRKMTASAAFQQCNMQPLDSHKRVKPGDVPDEIRPLHQVEQKDMGQKQQQQQQQQGTSQGSQGAVRQQVQQQQQLFPVAVKKGTTQATMQAAAAGTDQHARSKQLLGGMRQSAAAGMPPHTQQQQADTGLKAAVAAAGSNQQLTNALQAGMAAAGALDTSEAANQVPVAVVGAMEMDSAWAALSRGSQQPGGNTPAGVASRDAADISGAAIQDVDAPVVNMELDSAPQTHSSVSKPENIISTVTAEPTALQGQWPAAAAAAAAAPCEQQAAQEQQQPGRQQQLPQPSTQQGATGASMLASQALDENFSRGGQLQGSARSAAAAAAKALPDSQQLPDSLHSAAGTAAPAAAVLRPDSQQLLDSQHSAAGTAAPAAAVLPPTSQQLQSDTPAQAAAVAAGSWQQPGSLTCTAAVNVKGAPVQDVAITCMAVDLDNAPQALLTVSKPQQVSTVGAVVAPVTVGATGASASQAQAHLAQAHTSPSHPAQLSTDSDLSALPADLLQLLPALPALSADGDMLMSAQFLKEVSCGMFKLLKAVGKAEWQREAVRGLSAAFKTEEGRRSFQSLVYPMLLGAVQAGEKGMVVDVLADWLGKE